VAGHDWAPFVSIAVIVAVHVLVFARGPARLIAISNFEFNRVESAGRDRRIIKYIGSASNIFRERPNKDHRNKRELVDVQFRMDQQISVSGDRVIFQNAHYHDLVSWHGLAKLPKTSRGEGRHRQQRGKGATQPSDRLPSPRCIWTGRLNALVRRRTDLVVGNRASAARRFCSRTDRIGKLDLITAIRRPRSTFHLETSVSL
jgi:hypothetical protein